MNIRRLIASWLTRHVQVLLYALGQLTRSPISTLMTASVIGIALALPSGLYLLLENGQQMNVGWSGGNRLSLFLKKELSARQAEDMRDALLRDAAVADAHLITAAQALDEYKRHSGFGEALEALDHNPLPAVIVVEPTEDYARPDRLNQLVQSLQEMDGVDIAQFDLRWVERFAAILGILKRGVLVLAGLLALAVLLIIGNTIRLAIENRREEIEINRLFGATNAFIRRPFLYTGLWYGLLGGLLAWLLISLAFQLLQGPVRHLADLYASSFLLQGLGPGASLVLVGGGAVLGLAGSWLAVGRHLRAVEVG